MSLAPGLALIGTVALAALELAKIAWFQAHGISVLCAESAPLRALIELVRIPDFASVHSSLREALDVCRQQVAAGAEHEEIKNVSPRTRAAAAGGA